MAPAIRGIIEKRRGMKPSGAEAASNHVEARWVWSGDAPRMPGDPNGRIRKGCMDAREMPIDREKGGLPLQRLAYNEVIEMKLTGPGIAD